jgi:hypothetical protein|uniref:Uncharacterized protein n=1 Tax=Myoviridae sp. ctPuP5 TaxID=2823543 RepID=A0A8S5L9Q9_9CAUD|nr:MAG TPA: hypothetical protein [Myoviridae sp. ctPuP5]
MDKKIYCVEFINSNGKCRCTLSSSAYEELSVIGDESEKLKYINDYFNFDSIKATQFVRQFITLNDEIMIGCIERNVN